MRLDDRFQTMCGLPITLPFFCFLNLPGARFDDGAGGDNEVQRTMLELINQLDGFDPRGNIKVLMATNRPDTLDPALMRPGRLDRKIEFSLPDLEVSASCRRLSSSLLVIMSSFLTRVCSCVSGSHTHLQDSRPLYECGERHSLRAAGSSLSQQHR